MAKKINWNTYKDTSPNIFNTSGKRITVDQINGVPVIVYADDDSFSFTIDTTSYFEDAIYEFNNGDVFQWAVDIILYNFMPQPQSNDDYDDDEDYDEDDLESGVDEGDGYDDYEDADQPIPEFEMYMMIPPRILDDTIEALQQDIEDMDAAYAQWEDNGELTTAATYLGHTGTSWRVVPDEYLEGAQTIADNYFALYKIIDSDDDVNIASNWNALISSLRNTLATAQQGE